MASCERQKEIPGQRLGCRVWCPKAESTTTPASRASPVVVVLDLIVAKQTDLVAALARPEVLVSHVHVLHTEWAACHVTDASDLMSDGNAGQASRWESLTITLVHGALWSLHVVAFYEGRK